MPLENETPAQAMKRIEAEIRSPPVMPFAGASIGPGQTYSGTGGLRAGPLSAMGIVAGDSSGAPQVYGGRAALNAGPVEVSYRHMQPSAPVAPVQSLGVTARPFDPDMYFGAEATQGPGGRSYGLSAGKGDFNATAGYTPQNRGMNVGFEFKRNFAEGGPTEEPRPLTIFAKGPKAAPEGEVDVAGPLTQMAEPKPDPYAGVPAPEAYSRRFADTLAGIPQSVIDYFTAKQAAPAPAQNAGEDIGFIGSSIAGLPGAAAGYFEKKAAQPDPSQRIAEDIMALGGGLKQMFMENPMGMAMDIMNLPGAVTSLHDASEAKQKYNEAVASGDMDKAAGFKNQFGLAMAGVLPVVGGVMKTGAKASKLGEEAARAARPLEEAADLARPVEGMSEKFIGKAGSTPEEMAELLDKVRGTEVGRMGERYQNLSAEEANKLLTDDLRSLAKEGEVGKEWYERSSKRILEFVGGDKENADKFAQLIAIYSPQTAVDVNTQNAMKAYNRALAGEKLWNGKIVERDMSFPTIKAANDYVRSLGGSDKGFTKIPLDDSGKRFLIAQHGNPSKYENIATLDRDLKAHLVMNEGVPFEGRKINNFYNNLMVQIDPARLQGSTQDLWMARAFGFLDDAVGGGAKYDYMERLTADLANEMGWKPHQIQAAIWTAMKTRQEGVKDSVKAMALQRGMADMVPDPTMPGKMIFKVRDEAKQAYGQLMRETALGAQITPEAIASAARDFSDFLDQNLAHITWEATPSTKVGHLEGFENLPPEAKAEYQMGMQQALQDADGNDLLAKYLGILSPGGIDAPGYWEGASNPQRITQIGATRVKAAGQKPDIDSASREMMDIYASALGLLLKQDGVGYHRPYYNPQISKANGVEYKFEKPLSNADIVEIGKALDDRFGGEVGLIPVGDKEIRIVNFGWPSQEAGFNKVYEYRTAKGKKAYAASEADIPADAKLFKDGSKFIEHETAMVSTDEKGKQSLTRYRNQRDFHEAVDEIFNTVKVDNAADSRLFASDGDLISNTTPKQAKAKQYPGWKGNPNGEGYIQRLRASGRPDVLEYLSDFLAPRVEAFDKQFAETHGLKRNEKLEAIIRNAKEHATRKAEGGAVRFADGGPVQGAPAQPNIEQGVGETAADITKLAQEGDLDRRKIAYLIRQASTGTIAPDKAFEFAGEILSNDVQALLERFQRYPRAMRILARVDLALGGLGGQSLGTAANQRVRTKPVTTGEGFAKGGKVGGKKKSRVPYQGDNAAFEQFSDFALETYGPQIGKNMINRADGNAAKLLFALNQYEKNVQSQDPSPATMQAYKAHLAQLTGIAKQFKIDPRAAFNRTTDALDTRKELDGILKNDHKMNPAFKAALDRMSRLVGSR